MSYLRHSIVSKLAIGRLLMLFIVSQAFVCKPANVNVIPTEDNSVYRIAFWNLENLFDTQNDAWNDDDFTPDGKNKWNAKRYESKLTHLAQTIDSLNPDVLGVCEVEKREVLEDLIATKGLKNKGFKIEHFDSPDERGIDVALLYKTSKFKVLHSKIVTVVLPDGDKTRDILTTSLVSLNGKDTFTIYVNHWPSRREGTNESSFKRAIVANTLLQHLEDNHKTVEKLIIMGDFNDNPWDSSMRKVLHTCKPSIKAECDLYNLAALLNIREGGSLKHAGRWDLFDQIIISKNMWGIANSLHFVPYSFQVYSPSWMKTETGKYKGTPFRTYGGTVYQDGYSDHFPVYAILKHD
jgi:predicted extracellular nuclease